MAALGPRQNRKRKLPVTIILLSLSFAALALMCMSVFLVSSSNVSQHDFIKPTTVALSKTKSKVRDPSRNPATVRVEAYFVSDQCKGFRNRTRVQASSDKPSEIKFDSGMPQSMRVVGQGELRLFDSRGTYTASVVELEGCIPILTWPEFTRGELTYGVPPRRVDPQIQSKFFTGSDPPKPQTRIVFSVESSIYFGYQSVTNSYAFLNSNQTNASWLRLLTAQMPDDLSERLPTFTAPRTLYSKEYVPINKPDIIDKWFNSEYAPHPDDTIVVIDPDNWLLKDVNEWATRVSRKYAIGQAAYYHTDPNVQKLWREVCQEGCDNTVHHVGVPYVIKASDLKEVAPLWRKYTILLNEKRKHEKQRFKRKYSSLSIDWTSEMFAWNFANAHLGIETEVVHHLQIRDVDGRVPKEKESNKATIHMGRAWFPKKHAALAEKWRHTEGKDFAEFGIQVWCKCNETAHEIMPWPLPEGLDFQSYHTLRLLHEARKWYGPIPENETFRMKNEATMA